MMQDAAMADRQQTLAEREALMSELDAADKRIAEITDIDTAKTELASLLAQFRG
jgi:hypothetical protein